MRQESHPGITLGDGLERLKCGPLLTASPGAPLGRCLEAREPGLHLGL